ncbi:hypothetical protein [Taibaiella koreensis]|uniref:hypothetical protein n=1 Tax=Taibaiella koreensis TaxID=1268548 RepID=UPI000E59E953|nr:hypothetical protein [Taibaiella koreensis]
MDDRGQFFATIFQYYTGIAEGKISRELLMGLCDKVTDYYFEQYGRFFCKYPKSTKRYASFQLKDLDHPQTFEMIVAFFKEKLNEDYRVSAMQMLQMNDEQLRAFEQNRVDFYNMF